ncbi:MAG: glycosyltransferase family 2 protein [Candidatus Brocadiaceae bacterium]|nr:glycosyltransferase family 2 protein [Candidatus Brocadiaceae bacterium]
MNQNFSISACIITLNEASRIRDCLESIKWVAEIIVVDSYSSDNTVEICKEYTERVYQRTWPGNIEQKNYSIGLARHDWILSLDADERLSGDLIREVQEALHNPKDIVGFFFPRLSRYLGKWIYHGDWYPDYQLRLFKREHGKWQGTNPHGRVFVSGKTRRLKHSMFHFNYKNFSHQLKTIDNYSDIFASVMLERGKGFSLFQLVLRPLYKFIKVYILKRGLLDGLPGFILAVSNAFYIFVKYVKLWEQIRNNEKKNNENEKNV